MGWIQKQASRLSQWLSNRGYERRITGKFNDNLTKNLVHCAALKPGDMCVLNSQEWVYAASGNVADIAIKDYAQLWQNVGDRRLRYNLLPKTQPFVLVEHLSVRDRDKEAEHFKILHPEYGLMFFSIPHYWFRVQNCVEKLEENI